MASIKPRDTSRGRKYDVRYRLPSGEHRKRTFRTKREADRFAVTIEADRVRGGLVDPRAGQVTVAEYAGRWLASRSGLRPRTREMYESMLRVHVLPALGDIALSKLTPSAIRQWHSAILEGSSPTMAGKSYRLLRAILATAVDDDVLVKSPARIKRAGHERAPERRVPSLPQLYALADAVDGRYRALVLTAGLGGAPLG